jgi:hypothetical protein
LGGVLVGAPATAFAQALVPCNGPALQSAVAAANTAGGGTLNLTPGCTYRLTTPDDGENGLAIIYPGAVPRRFPARRHCSAASRHQRDFRAVAAATRSRFWRDLATASRHAAVSSSLSRELYGRALLGIEEQVTEVA